MSKLSFLMRQIISVLLITLFAFGITPVILLHNLIADHTDVSYHDAQLKGTQVSKSGINCHCESFVVEAQFLNTFKPISLIAPDVLPSLLNTFYKSNFYSQHHFFAELRGPPCFA